MMLNMSWQKPILMLSTTVTLAAWIVSMPYEG